MALVPSQHSNALPRARAHGTTISQPTWHGVPDRLHPAHGAGAGPATFEILEDLVCYVSCEAKGLAYKFARFWALPLLYKQTDGFHPVNRRWRGNAVSGTAMTCPCLVRSSWENKAMQRQRGELVPVAEALADMPGPIQALRETPPPARRGFTLADQVNQLVGASEADPERGFMARTMALCSLPRSNPGNRLQYKRVNGPYTLYMIAGGGNKLPFGNLPRLLMAWVSTEAVRTQSRELVMGRSLSEFMRTLGVYDSSGRTQTRLRNQMKRLFSAHVSLIYEDEHREATAAALIADLTDFWWNPRRPDQPSLWESKIHLSEPFFNEIIQHPVPIDMKGSAQKTEKIVRQAELFSNWSSSDSR